MPLLPTARAARPPRPAGQPRAPEPAGGAAHASQRPPGTGTGTDTGADRPGPPHPAAAGKQRDPGRAKHQGKTGLQGQKQALPHKPCQTCGRPMSWRKRWARCWDEVRHCSDACRRGTPRHG